MLRPRGSPSWGIQESSMNFWGGRSVICPPTIVPRIATTSPSGVTTNDQHEFCLTRRRFRQIRPASSPSPGSNTFSASLQP